jgi:hypothetical protein
MAWWVVMLLPLPIVAVLGLLAVIAIAFSVSAEEDRRRLRLQRWTPPATDATPDHSGRASVHVSLGDRRRTAATPVERVGTVQ